MERVLLVTRDQHLAGQLKSWLEEFPAQTALEVTPDLEAWYQGREGPKATETPAPIETPENAAADSSAATAVDAPASAPLPSPTIIVLDELQPFTKNPAWISLWKKRLGTDEPPTAPLFLVISADGALTKPELFLHYGADDLITRPIDRTILLQKLEIMIARGKSISPSFLFRLKSEFEVEIGKDCIIEEISEVEIFLKNPLPLKFASHATLHSDLFGEGPESRIDVIVEASEMLAQDQGWRVHLRYFGLTVNQLSHVRQAIRRIQGPHAGPKKKPLKKLPPLGGPPVLIEEFRPLRLAVVDLDRTTAQLFASALESHVHDLKLTSFATPSHIFKALQRLAPEPAAVIAPVESPAEADVQVPLAEVTADAPAVLADASDDIAIDLSFEQVSSEQEAPTEVASVPLFPSNESAVFLVRADDGQILKIESALEETDTLLGLTGLAWKERPESLMSGILKEDREVFQEALEFTGASGKGESILHFQVGTTVALLQFKLERVKEAADEQPALIAITVTAAPEEHRLATDLDANDFQFDALVVDAGYLKNDPALKVRVLREAFVKAGLCETIEKAPLVFVVAAEKSGVTPRQFHVEGVSHFAWKIADRRHIVDTFLVFAPKDVWTDGDLQPTRVPTRTQAHISRQTLVEELSEFGLVIKDALPFRVGAALRFFSALLGHDEHGILARCSSSVAQEDAWVNEFVFFGSSEDFQQKIRKFVRSEFSRKRAAEQAG